MKVGKEIALEAKKKAICQEWFSEMTKQNNIQPLCEMYFKGSDWAMENDFPSLELLRKFKGNPERFGLYADFIGSAGLLNVSNTQRIAFFGNSQADLICEDWSVCEVYVRHNSEVKITAGENAIVIVNLLDSANIEILAEENANVKVYQYGSQSNFTVSGSVEIIERSWQK